MRVRRILHDGEFIGREVETEFVNRLGAVRQQPGLVVRIHPGPRDDLRAVLRRRALHRRDDLAFLLRRVVPRLDQQFPQRQADTRAIAGRLRVVRLKGPRVVVFVVMIVVAHSAASSQCSKISISSWSPSVPA